MTTGDPDLDDKLHEMRLAKLDTARAAEKSARRLREQGKSAEAIEAYDRARDLYMDTNLAFDEHGESDVAQEVQKAIKRCGTVVSNIRYPKETRPPATTPRPCCLACKKPLRRYKRDGQTFDDGTPQEWGDYGDNRFCGLTCGWRWACRNSALPTAKKVKR